MEGFEKIENLRELIDNDSLLVEFFESWMSDDELSDISDFIKKELDY